MDAFLREFWAYSDQGRNQVQSCWFCEQWAKRNIARFSPPAHWSQGEFRLTEIPRWLKKNFQTLEMNYGSRSETMSCRRPERYGTTASEEQAVASVSLQEDHEVTLWWRRGNRNECTGERHRPGEATSISGQSETIIPVCLCSWVTCGG